MRSRRPLLSVPLALLLVASTLSAAAVLAADGPGALDTGPAAGGDADAEGHTATTTTVEGAGDVPIEVTIIRPAGASTSDPVPMLLHGHGWGGEGWDGVNPQNRPFLQAGYGIASIDMRGHGNSGGQARVMSPDHEAEDVQNVITHVAGLDWVETDAHNDPVLGAIGGSYGGGYQLVTALDAAETGSTRIDAVAPEITWFNLTRSLAPNGVLKSEWADALVGVAKGPPRTDTHPELVDKPYAYATATGDLPTDETPGVRNVSRIYYKHSPAAFVDRGTKLDVPALFLQGMTDTLFPLDQALANYRRTLTDEARQESYVVGHTTGHVLPSLGPPPGRLQGVQGGGHPCAEEIAGSETALRIAFFDHQLKGEDRSEGLPSHPITVPTDAAAARGETGRCLGLDSVPEATKAVSPDGPILAASAPAGAPVLTPLDEGNATLVGSPEVTATVTSTSVDTRFFVSLAVGPDRAQARVVDSQWRPVHLAGPVRGAQVTVDLADVAVDVGTDEKVYLATATTLDMYNHHSSRTPGAVLLEDVQVRLPTLSSAS